MSEVPWAQLVSLTDTVSDPVMITKDKFLVGRAKTSDLCFIGNKLMSGTHCFIFRDDDGIPWLQDTSTNGTLINMKKKIQGGKLQLRHGDEISLVFRRTDTDQNIGYIFQDLEELKKEQEESSSSELDADGMDGTLEYSSDLEISLDKSSDTDPQTETKKRRSSPEPSDTADTKKRKMEDDPTKVKKKDNTDKKKPETKAEQSVTATTSAKVVPGPSSGGKGQGSTDPEEKDPFEETLICIICQEIMHDCISLQPCMHSFCAGCYSCWMDRSRECPSCRKGVDRINKNHLVNNLVEAYLKEHPEKKRPEEDLKELDAKNKITKDMLYPKSQIVIEDDDEDEDEDEDDDDVADSDDDGMTPYTTAFGTVSYTGHIRPPKTVCRQCPDYKDPSTPNPLVAQATPIVSRIANFLTGAGTTANSGAGPSTATAPPAVGDSVLTSSTTTATNTDDEWKGTLPDEKVMPDPPAFSCRLNQTHILCQCCLQAMPDRRHDHTRNPDTVPPQQCQICYRSFCHAYWGCHKMGCNGCVGRFKEMNFSRQAADTLILSNTYESDILKEYLKAENISVKDLLQLCCEQLDNKTWTCRDQAMRNINSKTAVCYACGIKNFRDLAYHYRTQIPVTSLPAAAKTRSNCHWGKHCRTQHGKPHHAARFNHICEQTRTT